MGRRVARGDLGWVTIGKPLSPVVRPPRYRVGMHIAVIMPRWVGDAVMATPALRSLRAQVGSSARITGVMRPVIADLLAGSPWFDAVIPYDRHRHCPQTSSAAAHLHLPIQVLVERSLILPSLISHRLQSWVLVQSLSAQWLFAVKMVEKQLQFVRWSILDFLMTTVLLMEQMLHVSWVLSKSVLKVELSNPT